MSKVERQKAGYKRMTAYCVAEGFRMKLLTSFLKREHNTQPRVFDEAMYVVRMFFCLESLDILIVLRLHRHTIIPSYPDTAQA